MPPTEASTSTPNPAQVPHSLLLQQRQLMVSTAAEFLGLSGDSFYRKKLVWKSRFAATFGLCLESAVDVWTIVAKKVLADGLRKVHFLWCLVYLKEYPTERSAAGRFKTSESNWRDKVHQMLRVFSEMDEIHFEDRFENWHCKAPSCYVDGIDVLIQEVCLFFKGLYNHKFKHTGYQYQVASAIATSKFVHISGSVPCGLFNDLAMVKRSLLPRLGVGEKVAADEGYVGVPGKIMTRLMGNTEAIIKHNCNLSILQSRHETMNGKLKDFGILFQMFRGNREEHYLVFQAVAQITQVKMR
ncbi:hypothetical protein BDR26DRAFT_1002385 [Obelidium mucronatum]|nr:hypothetical protein BDR26DRAFT_1002385 [Obelidium mucronatum]